MTTTPARTMRFLVEPTEKNVEWLNVLLYGNPGMGKTTLAATAADVEEMCDVLMADVEGGALSITGLHKNLQIVRVYNNGGIADIYKFLALHCKFRETGNTEQLEKVNETYGFPKEAMYRTFIFDSLTEGNKNIMYQLLGIKIENYESTSLDEEPDAPEFKEWGKASEMIRLHVRAFRNLPIHTIFVCGAAMREDERKRSILSPALPGQLAKDIQGFVDVVGYIQLGQVADGGADSHTVRRLYLSPTPQRDAKSRLKYLKDEYIDDPTMGYIFEHAGITHKE